MEGSDLDIILKLLGIGAGAGGGFALVLKMLPMLLSEWEKSRARSSKLSDQAFDASGMTLEALVKVITQLQDWIEKLEEKITTQQGQYEADSELLRARYEEDMEVLVVRQRKQTDEMLGEIKVLKSELSKYRNMDVTDD